MSYRNFSMTIYQSISKNPSGPTGRPEPPPGILKNPSDPTESPVPPPGILMNPSAPIGGMPVAVVGC
jgi:hypothetical protein